MRLKLTLERGVGRESVDLLVGFEPTTTVGELADFLVGGDPDSSPQLAGACTLVRPDSGGTLDPAAQVRDVGIRSGAVVRLAPLGEGVAATPAIEPAAVLVVVSGPDAGREFSVPFGTSVVGRDRSCDVRLSDPLVSRKHARLHVGDRVELVDMGSSNGLQVGEDRTDQVVLRPGDVVGIGDTLVSVRQLAVRQVGSATPAVAFNRPPRVCPRFVGSELAPPEPPEPPAMQRFPILPLFAPMILGVVLYLATRSLVSIIFVAMSPLLIVANAAESRLAGRKSYQAAIDLFRQDVSDLVAEATDLANEEVAARLEECPSPEQCAEAISTLSPVLWSRWPDLPGFGELRLGLGRRPSRSRIEHIQGRRNNRALWHELDEAIAPFATVEGVPVVTTLEEGAIGVAGPRDVMLGVARSLVLQVAALHSPADFVLAGVASTQTCDDWEWIKWLPHCHSSTNPLGEIALASSSTACSALLDELESLIAQRETSKEAPEKKGADCPSVLVVVEDDAPITRSRATNIGMRGAKVGIHLLWLAADSIQLPAVCRMFVEVEPETATSAAGFVHTEERVEPLQTELVTAEKALDSARRLAPVYDVAAADDTVSDLPQTVSLVSLVGNELARAPEAVIERWVESRSIQSGPNAQQLDPAVRNRGGTLRAIVGETASGVHILDLRSHGPHALVGGTTGSGKSELLQSWILGMALSHSPERVTFLLVDYKGGSAFSDCRHLPHTVGLVTDLTPHLVRRALTSLTAEIRYREALLHRKRAKDLVSLERTGDPEAPPSLVIVVDEFAALVQEVPEFVDGVVDVAQRGRSLGLHLILGTQRPAGVIKDNLRANTNLRIALRVADDADSMDVLGASDAASFDATIPGRAMSRTGPSQLVPFQSAYIGGWTSDVPLPPQIDVSTLGFGARVSWTSPTDISAAVTSDPGPTDVERLVTTLQAASQLAELPLPRLPWLEELAPVYDLALLPSPRRDDQLVFAVADDPEHQSQPTVAFRPDEDGNLAVYGTGNSGKSTLLRSIAVAASFTVRGGPCHIYGLDFGSRGLQMLEALPHVGSIVAGSDSERVGRLLGMLRGTIDERATRYANVGAGTITTYRSLANCPQEPRIILLVDGMGAFRTAYEGTDQIRMFESFLSIAADGRSVGVHVVLSADRPGALPAALSSQVQRRVVLRLADSADYATFGLPTDVIDQDSPPGRGLLDEREIQVAVLGKSADMTQQAREVDRLAEAMRNAGVVIASPVERLADLVHQYELPANIDGMPVLGLSGVTLAPVTFSPTGTFTVAGGPGSGRTTTVAGIVSALRRWKPTSALYYMGHRRSPLLQRFDWDRMATEVEDVAKLAQELPALLHDMEEGDSSPAVIVLDGLSDFLNSSADLPLQDLIRVAVEHGHLVVSEGEPNALGGPFPLLSMARSSRSGIVLQPESGDGMLLRSQFPARLRRSEFPPGRGLYVQRGGLPQVIQVAMATAGRTAP